MENGIEELTKLFVEYNIPDNQVRRLVEAYKIGGYRLYSIRIREQVSRGFIPPKVARVLLNITPRENIPQILTYSSKLADYTFAKPFIEHWDEFSEVLKRRGINISLDDIVRIIISRLRMKVIIEMQLSSRKIIDRIKFRDIYRFFFN